jgi:transcriptional regulator with GAF, ATPase, and Fis domain
MSDIATTRPRCGERDDAARGAERLYRCDGVETMIASMSFDDPRPSSVAADLAEIARAVSGEPTVALTLQRIVALAVEKIDGCDEAGVLLVRGRDIIAGAWSNDVVREIEEMECEIGEGPCLDAIAQRPMFESPDLRDQLSRWPTFAARAVAAGIHSMLAFRLFAADDTLGALDLYGDAPGAFDESARAFGTVFAAHAALALAGAQLREHDLDNVDNLYTALEARDIIGQAKGILMATRQIDSDAAFELLRITSNTLNLKLRAVADHVVRTHALPEP